jgi:hypothetical protein
MTPTLEAMGVLARTGAALERRTFLRVAGALAAASVLPIGCGGVPERWAPGAGAPLAVLSPRGYATFTAAAARLVGPTGSALIAQRAVDVGRTADGFLVRAPSLAGPFAQALLVLEFAVWPLVPKARPFTALGGPAQDGVLDALMRSRFDLARQVFAGVRSLAMLAFYSAPASRAVSGYPGPFGSAQIPIGAAMIGPGGVW